MLTLSGSYQWIFNNHKTIQKLCVRSYGGNSIVTKKFNVPVIGSVIDGLGKC